MTVTVKALLAVAGGLLVTVGVALAWLPAGLMVAGALVLAVVWRAE